MIHGMVHAACRRDGTATVRKGRQRLRSGRSTEKNTEQNAAENHPKKRIVTVSNLLLGLAGFLFLASLSVILVLNLRTIYYFDIGFLQLEKATGLSESVIRRNYDALIDYNLAWKGIGELKFPDFPMSEHGKIHFEEVKNIFVGIQYLAVVSGVISLLGLWKKFRKKDYGSLKLLSVMTFLLPVLLGVLAAANWEQFFVCFHQMFFQNDYWLFDPVTDPVIEILPDLFFAHCAAAILFFLFLCGILAGVWYRLKTGRRSSFKK